MNRFCGQLNRPPKHRLVLLVVVKAAVCMALCAFSSADAQTGSFLPTWVQQSPATSPPARTWAEMAYDAGTSTIVLYSGATSSSNSRLVSQRSFVSLE